MKLEKSQRYRVTRAGARLCGWKPIAPWTQQGCQIVLQVGAVLEYLGWVYSGGSDGIDIHGWRLISPEHEDAEFVREFSPKHPERSSIFDTRPDPSFLELVDA